MTDKYKKIIVHEDSAEPYKNEYSNSHKKNIVWGALQDYCITTDNYDSPVYYSPQFIKNKSSEFIGAPIILTHTLKTKDGENIKVGKGVDVVYNNNGIVDASGDIIEADSRFWYCGEIDEEALNKYGITLDDIEIDCAYSTHFKKPIFENVGKKINGYEYNEDVKYVVDAVVYAMALLYKQEPRFNVCGELYNSASTTPSNNINTSIDLNCKPTLSSGDRLMDNNNEEVKQIVAEAVKAEMSKATDDLKNAVADVVKAKKTEEGNLTNSDGSCGKTDDLSNADTDSQLLQDIKTYFDAKFDELSKKLEELKTKDSLTNSDDEGDGTTKSDAELSDLTNSATYLSQTKGKKKYKEDVFIG